MSNASMTRGKGLLEPFLAWMRARRANRLIPDALRAGRILDIGCGTYPYFLSHTYFKEKYGVDQLPHSRVIGDIQLHTLDLNTDPHLPFPDEHFQAVTMLAVAEHLDPEALRLLFQDVYRVLAPGGRLVLTTPAAWANPLLEGMARVRLVSPEEINEHTFVYTLPLLGWYLGQAGFAMHSVRFGTFELWMNLWATAEK